VTRRRLRRRTNANGFDRKTKQPDLKKSEEWLMDWMVSLEVQKWIKYDRVGFGTS
jgi:hypothetical protein